MTVSRLWLFKKICSGLLALLTTGSVADVCVAGESQPPGVAVYVSQNSEQNGKEEVHLPSPVAVDDHQTAAPSSSDGTSRFDTEVNGVFNRPVKLIDDRPPVNFDQSIQRIAESPERSRVGSVEDVFGHDPCGCDTLGPFAEGFRDKFRNDLAEFLPMLRDDARGIVNGNNAAILGGALATAIVFRQDLDAEVRDNTARHPLRWGGGSQMLGRLGDARYQVPVLLAVYGISLQRDDDELHGLSASLISAYTINGLSTLAIKAIANTDRPTDSWNGGMFGFPSFHSSSSFAIAAVLDEHYGHKTGLPAYALAGLISWSRIDERDHDLSDVLFGAALGYVIGKSLAGRHLCGDSRVRLLPYVHLSDGSTGLMLDWPF